jgi:hypothetical protein
MKNFYLLKLTDFILPLPLKDLTHSVASQHFPRGENRMYKYFKSRGNGLIVGKVISINFWAP